MSYIRLVHTTAAMEIALLDRLATLAEEGEVTPDVLVHDAEPLTSSLHCLFEWDDSVAGQRYRLEQARLYIARVEYIPAETKEPLLIEMPIVHSQASYRSARQVSMMDDPLGSIERCQAEIDDLCRRYIKYEPLMPVVSQLAIASKIATKIALSLDIEPTEEELAELPAYANRQR